MARRVILTGGLARQVALPQRQENSTRLVNMSSTKRNVKVLG